MKIIEFDKLEREQRPAAGRGRDGIKIVEFGYDGVAKRMTAPERAAERRTSDVQLFMFQTGTLKTKLKYIKMNQGDGQDFEIPVPWFLIKHPRGNVVIDGGNAAEVALDPRGHWGSVVDAYDPVMGANENCIDQLRGIGVRPDDIRYVLQSHLHLDHTGAVGRFPKATTIVQRIEHEYAYSPDWFSAGAYIRADFDKRGIDWQFLGGEYTDFYDLYGDGTIKMIFTPGHSVGHQSFLITLPNTGPVLLAIDAAYTKDHWDEKALPGLVCSSVDAVASVRKLREVAAKTGAMIVTGHDPDLWRTFQHAPASFYD